MSVSLPRTIADVFAPVLAVDPDREALVTRSGRWSYAELDRLAIACRARARARWACAPVTGSPAACPTTSTSSSPSTAPCASARCGWASTAPSPPPEKQFLLDDSGTSLLLCDAATAEQVGGGGVRVLTVEDGPGEWRDALAAAPDAPFTSDIDPYAPAGIAYTSGTTGYPKGATHSQHNLLVPGAMLGAVARLGAVAAQGRLPRRSPSSTCRCSRR